MTKNVSAVADAVVEPSAATARRRRLPRRWVGAAVLAAGLAVGAGGVVLGLPSGGEDAPAAAAGPQRPARWTSSRATDAERARVPAPLRSQSRDAMVAIVDPAGRRLVAVTLPASGSREAERRTTRLEARLGVVDGASAYNRVAADGRAGYTFVGRDQRGRPAAVWTSAAPPRALRAAAGARPARGRLMSAALEGVQCRATSSRALDRRFAGPPPRGFARREAATCRSAAATVGVVGFEPARGVDADGPLTVQNHAFRPERFPDVATPCGTVGGTRMDGRWVISLYVTDSVTGRPRWAFMLLGRDRRATLRLACRLVRVAGDV